MDKSKAVEVLGDIRSYIVRLGADHSADQEAIDALDLAIAALRDEGAAEAVAFMDDSGEVPLWRDGKKPPPKSPLFLRPAPAKAEGAAEAVCETCEGRGEVVTYNDPYGHGDFSSPNDSMPCPDCTHFAPAGKVRVTEANLVRAWRNRFISERMNAYPDESYEMRRAKAEADANEYEAALEAALAAQPAVRDEVAGVAVAPIERDENMDRTYIPLPGGWEVQTKGHGSTFRICDPKGERLAIPDSPYLHETLERMAREVHAACSTHPAQPAVPERPKFTTGHCEENKKPGGCQRHNLHCGWPKCDRRPVAAQQEDGNG